MQHAQCVRLSRPFRARLLDPDLFQAAHEADAIIEVTEASGTFWRCNLRSATLKGHIFLHSAFPTDAPDAVIFGPDAYRFADVVCHALAGHAGPICRAIDICYGSGAAGIMHTRACPKAKVVLADLNAGEFALASVNVKGGWSRQHVMYRK